MILHSMADNWKNVVLLLRFIWVIQITLIAFIFCLMEQMQLIVRRESMNEQA